jgi:hypothetical protein
MPAALRQCSLLWTLILLSALPSLAQQELFLKHFSVDDGLPSNEVYRILEDTSGYLWITTDRGIVRYDGYAFEEMPVSGTSEIYPWFGIQQDVTGRLYFVGLKGHVAVYDNGRLYAHPYNDKAARLSVSHLTPAGFMARRDSLWFCYEDEGNFLLTPSGVVQKQGVAAGIHFDLEENFFYLRSTENNGNTTPVYIRWQNGSQSVDTIPRPTDQGSGLLHYETVNGQELLCIGRHVLFYKDRRRVGIFTFPRVAYSFCMFDDQHAMVGFANGGVGLYAVEEGTLRGPLQVWLPDLSVTTIIRDFQGGVWLATRESGLFYANPARTSYLQGQGPILFVEKWEDKLFTGYQSGLVQILVDGAVVQETRVPIGKEERVLEYGFSGQGEIIAYTQRGVYKYNSRWVPFASADTALLRISVRDLPGPADRRLLEMLRTIRARYDVTARRITSVFADTAGRIWLGTYEGLYRYTGDSLVQYADRNRLFADRIVALKELPDRTMVIATLGSGLVLYRDNRMYLLNKQNGLATSMINDVEVDADTIWLATNKGISKVVFVEDRFLVWNYGNGYGLPTLDIQLLSVVGGRIYFKWIDKLVILEKSRLGNLPPVGAPQIIAVTAGGRKVNADVPGVYTHSQNTLQITYNSVSLANGTRQVYRYRLEGFDNKWNVTTERQAVFTNLPPGAYAFSLQVADAQGNFVLEHAAYQFEIRPAFWQQWWFPFAVGLLLLLLAGIYFRGRLRSVKNKNQLMLDLAENQQKALVQLINPHFIFNILNTAQAAILKEDKMNAASIISRFAKLMRLSLELSREPFVRLDQEVELLKRYIDLEMIRTPGKFTYNIHVDPDINAASVSVPSMLIQPFIENAIKHGIMHVTDRIAHLSLRFEREGSLILCTVDDTGIGRERAVAINASRLRKHHSVGIDITCRRLRLLHREKNTEYRYLVKDKYDEQGEPSGTTVIFSIPFNQQ